MQTLKAIQTILQQPSAENSSTKLNPLIQTANGDKGPSKRQKQRENIAKKRGEKNTTNLISARLNHSHHFHQSSHPGNQSHRGMESE